MHNSLVDFWRENVIASASWILFEHGTCVLYDDEDASVIDKVTERFGQLGSISMQTRIHFLSRRDFAIIEFDGLTILLPARLAGEKTSREVWEESEAAGRDPVAEIQEQGTKRRKRVIETFNADVASLHVVHVQVGRKP